jgi:hypothetical protein
MASSHRTTSCRTVERPSPANRNSFRRSDLPLLKYALSRLYLQKPFARAEGHICDLFRIIYLMEFSAVHHCSRFVQFRLGVSSRFYEYRCIRI